MRFPLSLSAALFASVLCAAPAPPPGPTDEPSGKRPLQAEARVFAICLLRTADHVTELYVRPVTREELLLAALTGLYEAARQPVPPHLADDLREALAGKVRMASDEAPAAVQDAAAAAEVPETDRAVIDLIQHVRENVGNPATLRDRQPLLICCQALARNLDPYSGVVSGKELRRHLAVEEDAATFGLELNDGAGRGTVVVKAVQPGGPAQQAGVRPGDEITDLDGKPIKDFSRPELLQALRQPPDLADAATKSAEAPAAPPPPGVADMTPAAAPPPVKIALRRPDGKTGTVVLECRCFRPEAVLGVARREDQSWNYWVDERAGLAHVRLAALNKGSAAELRRVLSGLRSAGLRGLILDLRWCPGGLLDEAVDSANVFLDEGVTATVRTHAKEDVVYRSDGRGACTDFPMVVLVNGETVGGAELIAAALQDHGRAAVAGQRTAGKGSVQTQIPVGAPGAALKLTSGLFLRPSGKNLQRIPGAGPGDDWGVRPDDGLEFRTSPDLTRQLKEDWQRQTLRPGPSAERLPLDDPDADPQRQAALEALRGRVASAAPGPTGAHRP